MQSAPSLIPCHLERKLARILRFHDPVWGVWGVEALGQKKVHYSVDKLPQESKIAQR